ncbi:RNA polymerase sigma-70 factor (ECF subfamily) [Roseimicrobium gellanilyticum]|uniref:RNA polymerase sigma-70 factor (ECF subfamily) n=1 Tax=Roseimicrobium gellanilyticum TaxID=748857 RepID=A0A366HT50_9BACT|nr:RNA polymerase sigma-70 factor [Roseimicrobium gellanilyticum]RBP46104.1 RNA polymerase sigma-70 factor (ECF subfamily) [Roseimicrobium gellanilyticum]
MLEVFTEHRKTLFGIAYRMLGRVSEAEDMVQEVWIRWQKQDASAIDSPKSWLVSTMTRLCIDQLRSARREREEYYGVWLPEPLMQASGNEPDKAAAVSDSLTMAFMMMLESLDPVERATFLLREVFDYDYADTAAIVGKSEVNCRQIVRRAKAQLQARPQSNLTPNAQAQRLVEQFFRAADTGRIEELLSMLTEDATLYSDGGGRVRAAGRPICSADHVSRFLAGIWPRLPEDTEWRAATVNGRAGAILRAQGDIYGAFAFDIDHLRVQKVYFVLNPEKLRHLAGAWEQGTGGG